MTVWSNRYIILGRVWLELTNARIKRVLHFICSADSQILSETWAPILNFPSSYSRAWPVDISRDDPTVCFIVSPNIIIHIMFTNNLAQHFVNTRVVLSTVAAAVLGRGLSLKTQWGQASPPVNNARSQTNFYSFSRLCIAYVSNESL